MVEHSRYKKIEPWVAVFAAGVAVFFLIYLLETGSAINAAQSILP
ncbi:MAG: hypothetical protein PHG00_00265 [Methylococcales bacterium]|nr:hypothetical protein [Methylococcales bacterium]